MISNTYSRKTLILVLTALVLLGSSLSAQTILQVPERIQEQSQWCWDACSQAIMAYYGTEMSQCDIANWTRVQAGWGDDDCCTNGSGAICNQPWYASGHPGAVSAIIAHFGGITSTWHGSVFSQATSNAVLGNWRPYGFRWGWDGGGGHFLVARGFNGDDIHYMNPGSGYAVGDYDWMVSGGSHTWTETLEITSAHASTADISGTVTLDGGPLSGQQIRLLDENGFLETTATTNGSGNYVFSSVVQGLYTIEPNFNYADRYVPLNGWQTDIVNMGFNVTVDIPVGQVRFDSYVPPHGSTTPTSEPEISIHVWVLGGPSSLFDAGSIEMIFDGSVVAHSYSAATQVISYQVPPHANGDYTAAVDLDDTFGRSINGTSWTFTIWQPFGNVAGYVTCDGGPITNVLIELWAGTDFVASTYTDGAGHYRYNHLAILNGNYQVKMEVPPYYGPVSDTIVGITIFGWPDAEANFELLRIFATDLTPTPGFTVDTCQTMISAILNVQGGTLADIDPTTIVMALNGDVMPHSYNPGTGLVSYFTDPPLPNAFYTVTIDVDDMKGYGACQTEWQFEVLQPYGDVKGTVTDNGNSNDGLLGVPIALVNMMGDTLAKTVTEVDGSFFFGHIDNGDYIVTIWQMPLGYLPEFTASLPVTVYGWPPAEAHFPLNRDPGPPGCDGRSSHFWAWQVWGAIQNHQGLKYTRDDIICFREKTHAHFDPWIPHFVDVESMHDMFCTLFHFWSWNSTCRQLAMSHYYALLLNISSGRINTYDIVSDDGATAAQAVLYISQLLETGDPYDTKLALGLARAVNWEWCILPPGWIPLSTPHIAFKAGNEVAALPTEFDMGQNFPNPFNPSTSIQLSLPKTSQVHLDIFNLLGQKVTTLVDRTMPAGFHTITWDATGRATGVYFYRLTTDEYTVSRKMVLIK